MLRIGRSTIIIIMSVCRLKASIYFSNLLSGIFSAFCVWVMSYSFECVTPTSHYTKLGRPSRLSPSGHLRFGLVASLSNILFNIDTGLTGWAVAHGSLPSWTSGLAWRPSCLSSPSYVLLLCSLDLLLCFQRVFQRIVSNAPPPCIRQSA